MIETSLADRTLLMIPPTNCSCSSYPNLPFTSEIGSQVSGLVYNFGFGCLTDLPEGI